MLTNLVTYFLPKGLDVSNWSIFSQSRYLVYGHLITILIALLGMIVNINPFDTKPFFIDLALIVIIFSNLFLLKHSLTICRINFYVIVWCVIFGLAAFVNPLFGYEYYFMIWSVSAVMLFTRRLIIYLFFAIGVFSFHLPKLMTDQTADEFNFNPPFLFLMLLLIFLVFYSTNKYYVKVIHQKNTQLEKDKLLIEQQSNRIREVSSLQTRFFTNISHEFRTPLTLILGPIEEIREKVPDRQSQLYLGMMQKNARKLLNQVNQLLDLSKLDSGQLKLHVVQEDIVGFVKGVTMCFESLALSRNIDLAFFTDQETCTAWFDKDSIEKIMVNLLSNAFKFTEEAGSVSVEMAKLEEDKIEIKVSDTGRGIDVDELDKIFERYYHTESDMQASSGIGLALVKELVESHYGSINVRSAKNQGSCFTIILPLGKGHWKDASVFEENPGTPYQPQIEPEFDNDLSVEENGREASGNQKTVLVIEDNADVRLFIRESLKEKFDVLEAENGEMGLEKGEGSIPDVIITDIMMDGMDGYEVVKRLKQSEKTSHIPIIMLTAKADVDSKIKGLENEADDFITKPFERRELMVRISNLISNREKLKARLDGHLILRPGDIDISSIDQAFMEKLLNAIEENIDNNTFGVEELARTASMSRSQLHRKLQAIAGQPPNQFIRNFRLARAMELLKNNVGTVAEIAYMTGFTSPNYFSKCFNDQYGYTPGEVKKNTV